MHDRPTVDELLRAVELLLERELMPALEGARQYNARVATNVVRMVRRQLEAEESQIDAEWRGLDGLLGEAARPASLAETRTALHERNERLAERIRAGDADAGELRARVLEHVRATTRAKLEVSNPRWLED
jgi:hypothetical protein